MNTYEQIKIQDISVNNFAQTTGFRAKPMHKWVAWS